MQFVEILWILMWFVGCAVSLIGGVGVFCVGAVHWLTKNVPTEQPRGPILKRMYKTTGKVILFGMGLVIVSYCLENLIKEAALNAFIDFGILP